MTRVAAYPAPLLPRGSMQAIDLIRTRVAWCESKRVDILCCPEAVLGGLADNAERPADFAVDVGKRSARRALAPLASDAVTRLWASPRPQDSVSSTTRLRSFTREPSSASIASCIRQSGSRSTAPAIGGRSLRSAA